MSQPLDPNDFVISRKRKKYKFAKFHNSNICFEFEDWTQQPVDNLEIGAGTGLFSVELATLYPDRTYLAVDVKGDRLQTGAYEAESRGLNNIFFLRARADQLPEVVAPNSLHSLWVTFPDPFPKPGSAGRRLTHPTYLNIYQDLLTADGYFNFKTDARDLFHWTLEQLVEHNWTLRELSFDLHESRLSDEYKIMTTYEKRWTSEGIVTNFLSAKPGSQSHGSGDNH